MEIPLKKYGNLQYVLEDTKNLVHPLPMKNVVFYDSGHCPNEAYLLCRYQGGPKYDRGKYKPS